MKILLVIVTLFTVTAWSQENAGYDANDVNMQVEIPKFEGTFNDRYHALAEKQAVGSTAATCPECGDASQLWNDTLPKATATGNGNGNDTEKAEGGI